MRLILVLSILLLTQAAHASNDEYTGCWQSITDDTNNIVTFCANNHLLPE